MNVNTLNITIEQLVPSNHLVRKLDASIDFSFIYPISDPLLQSSSLRCSILIKEVTLYFSDRSPILFIVVRTSH